MNVHLRGPSLTEEAVNKNIKNKRTVHIKNTYISPYVLYNKKGNDNNNSRLEYLNKIFTNDKDDSVFIKGKNNYISTMDNNSHEKRILRYALFNEINLKLLKTKDERCELNTITTMIHMNSDNNSDKENEMIINEHVDLLENKNIKKVSTTINSSNILNSEKMKNALKSNALFFTKCSSNHKLVSNPYFNKKDYEEKQNGPNTLRPITPNSTYIDYLNRGDKSNANVKDELGSSSKYIVSGSSGACATSSSSGIGSSNHCIFNDSIVNNVIYKCEDSIPLGTILNIHNLDNNNSNVLTTVMLRNIPNKYTQNMLMDVMNKHFKGLYDFFYLPIDFRNKCNVGYAFINFIHPHYAELFIKFFNNYKLNAFKSNKVCTVTWGRVQGLKANIEHYRNSAIMTIPIPQYKPMLFQNGISVSWPDSDGPLPAIKLRSQKY
ncbi:MEI2-like RNA-binding protein [Plasmodium brasilianum]|uniref:MEI2-like RNA-binding protein, putative n=2 Tax=Plasmodium (Plasmodium) TaxID=418103 RepID=A0A1A8W618_PLAMA|nr:MEI2-like RNA-binding protein, putative [Plasmodium malariae]KAI4837270.1 MEI2-like RNA-binding protein [Plasmodium brasilianum]SBS87119.1 RNA-binding protein mei2 homologue, putative [Plasmodium malariae]SCO93151.1 MEI2-like RNA-binding protein, putative [Plasmodium malariae]